MHSATIKYFKTFELIHFQIKSPKGGQAKAKEGRMLPLPPPERNPDKCEAETLSTLCYVYIWLPL